MTGARESGAEPEGSAESGCSRALAAEVLEALVGRGQTVAAAESLTGGLVAVALTAAPGSSRAFRGSVTAYATEVKHQLLGVDDDLLAERGAVDPEVARQMAAGVRKTLGADWGVATTGVAGPEPQDGKPVGTVFAAVAGPGPGSGRDGQGTAGASRNAEGSGSGDAAVTVELSLAGEREAVREASVRGALTLLRDELTKNAGPKDTEQHRGNGCLQP